MKVDRETGVPHRPRYRCLADGLALRVREENGVHNAIGVHTQSGGGTWGVVGPDRSNADELPVRVVSATTIRPHMSSTIDPTLVNR